MSVSKFVKTKYIQNKIEKNSKPYLDIILKSISTSVENINLAGEGYRKSAIALEKFTRDNSKSIAELLVACEPLAKQLKKTWNQVNKDITSNVMNSINDINNMEKNQSNIYN